MSSANHFRHANPAALIAQANQLTGPRRFAEAVHVVKRLSELASLPLVWLQQNERYANDGGSSIAPRRDLPPLKWSSPRYDFAMKKDNDGKEEAHSRRDRREAASG